MFRRKATDTDSLIKFRNIWIRQFFADLELIVLAHDILKLLPKSNFSLHLNSQIKRNLNKYKSKLSKYYEKINQSYQLKVGISQTHWGY